MTRVRKQRRKLTRLADSGLMRMTDDKVFTPEFVRHLANNPDPVYEPWVVDRITAVLLAQAKDRSKHFHASSLGKCLRLQIFQRLAGPKPDVEPEVVRTNLFRDGHWRHLRLQADSLQAGIVDDIEVGYEAKAYELVGSMDGRKDRIGIEFKGAHEGKYRMVGVVGVLDEHRYQVESYLLLTELAGDPLDVVAVVYEDKTTLNWREFIVERDPRAQADLRRRLDELLDAWRNQRMPQRLPDFPDKACKNCPFKTDCSRIPTGGWIEDLMRSRKPKRYVLANP